MRRSIRLPALCAAISAILITPTTAADDAKADEGWTTERVTVTGKRPSYGADDASVTRTDIPLLELPQSVQVLTGKLLEEQDRTTLADALVNVSGVVTAQPSEAVLANPIVRGFESEIFIDGLIGYGDTAVIDPSSLAAVERIEVAKGPTSTLFGGGTGAPVGGLINIVTKTPGADPAYEARIRTGSFNTFAATVDLNQPLADDAGLRFTGELFSAEDYIEAVEVERTTLNPSFRARLGTQTDVDLRVLYNRIEQLEYAGLPAAIANAPGVDPFHFSGAKNAPKTTIENLSITGVATHRFSDDVSATLQVRRYDSNFNEYASFPFTAFFPPAGTVYDIIKGQLPADVREWTADASVSAAFATGSFAHKLLAGVQYDATLYDAAIGFDFAPIGTIDYADPASDLNFGGLPALTGFFRNEYGTTAAYIQDHVTLAEGLYLLASLRYSELSLKEVVGGTGTDETYREWNPRVGVTYEFAEGVAAFAGYATGSRLSLFFTGSAPPVPETSETFEGGLKFALKDAGLSGTLALYQITRQNVPTPDPLIPFASVQTGEQRATGFEADLIWEPSPNWSLLASYAHTETEVTRDNAVPIGDALTRVPEDNGRLAVRYRFLDGPLSGLGLGAGLTAASEAELTLPNTLRSDAYAVLDAQASYDLGMFEVGVAVENLTDEAYFTPYQYLGQAVVRPAQPLSAFLSLRAKL